MRTLATLQLILILFLTCATAEAFPQLLGEWQGRYGDVSTSGSANCQLCHGNANGGSPWNAYGWDLVIALDAAGCDSDASGSVDSNEAFACVEFFNSDGDTGEHDNLSEILAGTQPGWSAGSCNTLFSDSGTTLGADGPDGIGALDPPGTAPVTGCDTGPGDPPDPGPATIVTVRAGESIQAAIDAVAPGSTVIVEPGVYTEPGNSTNGLNITKGIRLIGMTDGDNGVVITGAGNQRNGMVAVPAGRTACMSCHTTLAPPFTLRDNVATGGPTDPVIHGLEIRNITIDGFINNGLFTERVDDFRIVNVHSVNNRNYGIFPTLSSNGLIQHSSATGADDSGIWVETSTDVLVTDNLVDGNVNGFEVSNSDRITIENNEVRNNTVGISLFVLTDLVDERPSANKILVRNNWIHDNNKVNTGTPGSLLSFLPSGTGVLLLAVDNSIIRDNLIENNDFGGIAVADYCLGVFGTPFDCGAVPPPAGFDPAPRFNQVRANTLVGNGTDPDPSSPFAPFAADLVEFALGDFGNCYSDNAFTTAFSLGGSFPACRTSPLRPVFGGDPRDNLSR